MTTEFLKLRQLYPKGTERFLNQWKMCRVFLGWPALEARCLPGWLGLAGRGVDMPVCALTPPRVFSPRELDGGGGGSAEQGPLQRSSRGQRRACRRSESTPFLPPPRCVGGSSAASQGLRLAHPGPLRLHTSPGTAGVWSREATTSGTTSSNPSRGRCLLSPRFSGSSGSGG